MGFVIFQVMLKKLEIYGLVLVGLLLILFGLVAYISLILYLKIEKIVEELKYV